MIAKEAIAALADEPTMTEETSGGVAVAPSGGDGDASTEACGGAALAVAVSVGREVPVAVAVSLVADEDVAVAVVSALALDRAVVVDAAVEVGTCDVPGGAVAVCVGGGPPECVAVMLAEEEEVREASPVAEADVEGVALEGCAPQETATERRTPAYPMLALETKVTLALLVRVSTGAGTATSRPEPE